MKEENTISKAAQSIIWMHVVIIVLTMLNNVEHGAHLYRTLSAGGMLPEVINNTLPYFVILTLDGAIFLFIFIGNKETAERFAWGMFVLNLLYWDFLGNIRQLVISLYHLNGDLATDLITKIIISVLFSGAFAYTIHSFSISFKKSLLFSERLRKLSSRYRLAIVDERIANANAQEVTDSLEVNNVIMTRMRNNLMDQEYKIKELTDKLTDYSKKEKQETVKRTCDDCAFVFPNVQDMGKIRGGRLRTKCKEGICKPKRNQATHE